MNTTARFTAALTLAAASVAAFAQATTPPSMAASQPNAVGVTPETAKAANDKAIQRSDVATVVKTGPTVADRSRQAKSKVESSVSGSSSDTTTVVDANANANRTAKLAPRTDRN